VHKVNWIFCVDKRKWEMRKNGTRIGESKSHRNRVNGEGVGVGVGKKSLNSWIKRGRERESRLFFQA